MSAVAAGGGMRNEARPVIVFSVAHMRRLFAAMTYLEAISRPTIEGEANEVSRINAIAREALSSAIEWRRG